MVSLVTGVVVGGFGASAGSGAGVVVAGGGIAGFGIAVGVVVVFFGLFNFIFVVVVVDLPVVFVVIVGLVMPLASRLHLALKKDAVSKSNTITKRWGKKKREKETRDRKSVV